MADVAWLQTYSVLINQTDGILLPGEGMGRE